MTAIKGIGKHATTVSRLENVAGSVTTIRYHDTDVVQFTPLTICLDSGGHLTATTKRRINQAAGLFDLPIRVYQHQGEWYVKIADAFIVPFTDGMVIHTDEITLGMIPGDALVTRRS